MSDDGTNWDTFHLQALEFREPDRRHLDKLKAGKVLEIGCGTGRWSSLFIEKGFTYFGIDVNPLQIGTAKDTQPGIFLCCDVRNGIPFPDWQFDYVFSCSFLQHFTVSRPKILQEIHRVLLPDGRLLFIEDDGQDWQSLPYFELIQVQEAFPLGVNDAVGRLRVAKRVNQV